MDGNFLRAVTEDCDNDIIDRGPKEVPGVRLPPIPEGVGA